MLFCLIGLLCLVVYCWCSLLFVVLRCLFSVCCSSFVVCRCVACVHVLFVVVVRRLLHVVCCSLFVVVVCCWLVSLLFVRCPVFASICFCLLVDIWLFVFCLTCVVCKWALLMVVVY